MISICVPSYNSLEYLKILCKSVKKNTKLPYELIIHDNGSEDQTRDWIRENVQKYTCSEKNRGFCGVNDAIRLANYDYVFIANSDMYLLPNWDLEIAKQIENFKEEGINRFTISCSLLEPSSNNSEYTYAPFGNDYKSFNEHGLMIFYLQNMRKFLERPHTTQWSHPILVPKFMLEEVGYLDESYFPGWNVDNDLPCSLYKKGCRNFIMLQTSKVYHFISKTFNKLPSEIKNMSGQDIFLKKWGLTTQEFRNRMHVAAQYRKVEDGIFF